MDSENSVLINNFKPLDQLNRDRGAVSLAASKQQINLVTTIENSN